MNRPLIFKHLLPTLGALLLLSGVAARPAAALPGPYFGRRVNFRGPSFTAADYVVATYYFYWYDVHSGAHLVNDNGSDALTEHPDYSRPAPLVNGDYASRPPAAYGSPPAFSYLDPAWHARELQRMAATGIDLMLADYWGTPATDDWSNVGLQQLDRAMNTLDAQHKPYPAVALYYDTSTLTGVDLSTPEGKAQFYGTIRDFYSRVLPRRWGRFDDRAIVWLFSSGTPARIDPAALREASDRFAAEFGGVRLFYVGDEGWRAAGANIDLTFFWGAAAQGAAIKDVASVGPGYNDGAVLSRSEHFQQPRDNGTFYLQGWDAVQASGRRIVAVETWNEFHEGTEVAPTAEYGDRFRGLTEREARRHHFNPHFVQQAYHHDTGRAVDATSLLELTGALSSGRNPADVRDTILNSGPARAHLPDRSFITGLYTRYLGRRPTAKERAAGLAALRQGSSRTAVRDGVLNGAAAHAALTDQQFITEAYRQLLGREPEPQGFGDWMAFLAGGGSRSGARNGFLNSVEFRYRDLSRLTPQQQASVFDFSGRSAR